MPWTFVRPRDRSLLAARPMLDIGTGDGQTLRALVDDPSGIVAIDRSTSLLTPGGLAGDVMALPFADEAFATVLAADLLHHVGDLDGAFAEIERVLRPDGLFVAWWYERSPHDAPDAPRFARTYEEVAAHTSLDVEPLELEIVLGGGPPTVGIVGRR
jgi:ubiquinone/menaquinone biosynthesis C-methylase UbiE